MNTGKGTECASIYSCNGIIEPVVTEQSQPVQKHIVLTGMPASGKSTIGVILAKILGYDFVDTDLVIQRRTGRRLPELIESEGLKGFLCLEGDIVSEIGPFDTGTVIATGGSVVYSEKAMRHLREIGRIVYLEVPFENLERRLRDMKSRGVVLRPGQSLGELYRERSVLYERYADITVREGDLPVEEVVRFLTEALTA